MTNLNNRANPFDFANPIRSELRFAGRSAELAEARYYLRQAALADQSVNLAITGRRASGKTSFLNVLDAEATSAGFIVARLDLNESDTDSELAFFAKLFDSVLTAACAAGAYNGLGGETYRQYRDAVDGLVIPSSDQFTPFSFPMQYARAVTANNWAAPVSDAGMARDLEALRLTAQHRIIIMIDEANVLSGKRPLLQKLRNLFQRTSGLMLVLAGTPNFIPEMNEVFSPLMRQFKTIEIGSFDNVGSTLECIERQLDAAGLDPKVLLGDDRHDITEIHRLTEGRPYEIQLFAHFMFRRVQAGGAREMELSVEVLDDVLAELDKTTQLQDRKFVALVRSASESLLHGIAVAALCDAAATADQTWWVAQLFAAPTVEESDFRRALEKLKEAGFLEVDDAGILSLRADDLDRLYLKVAVQQRCHHVRGIPSHGMTPSRALRTGALVAAILDGPWMPLPVPWGQTSSLLDRYDGFWEGEPRALTNVEAHFLMEAYKTAFDEAAEPNVIPTSLPWVRISVEMPWDERLDIEFLWNGPGHADEPTDWQSVYAEVARRIGDNGGSFSLTEGSASAHAAEEFDTFWKAAGNTESRLLLVRLHNTQTYRTYVGGDFPRSLRHASAASALVQDDDEQAWLVLNNAGYLRLTERDFQEAHDLFKRAAAIQPQAGNSVGIATYNLALAEFGLGHASDAEGTLRAAINLASNVPPPVKGSQVLWGLRRGPTGEVEWFEDSTSDVLSMAHLSLSALQDQAPAV